MSAAVFVGTTLLVAGCGDDLSGATPDGAPGADSRASDGAAPDASVSSIAFAVGGDFVSTGVASTVTVPDGVVRQNVAAGVAQGDPVVRRFGDEIFIINRFGGDNVTILDAASLTLVTQISTTAGTNPQDVAVVGDSLYVPTFAGVGVVVIDRNDPTNPTTIDLSAFDTTDGVPNCNSAAAVGANIFVSCGLLDDANFFAPVIDGRIFVIDPTNDTVTANFTTAFMNPSGLFEYTDPSGPLGGDLLMANVPSFIDYSSGCVERIPTSPPAAGTCLVSSMDLGGYPTKVVSADSGVYVASSDANNSTYRITTVDVGTGMPAAGTITPAAEAFTDFAVCSNGFVIAANTTFGGPSGVQVFHAASSSAQTPLLDIGIPPTFSGGLICL